jgi:hypothetical protein
MAPVQRPGLAEIVLAAPPATRRLTTPPPALRSQRVNLARSSQPQAPALPSKCAQSAVLATTPPPQMLQIALVCGQSYLLRGDNLIFLIH